ncbi:MAG: hypothetical protein ACK4NE_08330, partial [Albidovulum sp.]
TPARWERGNVRTLKWIAQPALVPAFKFVVNQSFDWGAYVDLHPGDAVSVARSLHAGPDVFGD